MKKYMFSLISVAMALLMISCANLIFEDLDLDMDYDDLDEFVCVAADGSKIKFEDFDYDPSVIDHPDYSWVDADMDTRTELNPVSLHFYFKNNILPGQEITVGKFDGVSPWIFGIWVSSSAKSYTDTYTGKMILKAKSNKAVVISMQNVKFSIKEGDYILNGDMVFKAK